MALVSGDLNDFVCILVRKSEGSNPSVVIILVFYPMK